MNSANTNHQWVKFGTLVATAIAFFMAIAVPEAFQERSLWFAIAYVLVRAVGLTLYTWISAQGPLQRATVRSFALLSLGSLGAVLLGGWIGSAAQYWLWGVAILLDIAAAMISVPTAEQSRETQGATGRGMTIHPDHFGERHGLFIIIALGESLIVAGSGVIGEVWRGDLLAVAILAVLVTCGLWWSYFHQAKPVLESAFAAREAAERGGLARDLFSPLHFPMLLGVISFAFAIEEAVSHPDEPLSFAIRLALALGLALLVGGTAIVIWRATQALLWPRIVVIAITFAAILFAADVTPLLTLTIAFVGVVSVALLEERAGNPLRDVQL